jgi:hypothetical protein
LNTTSKCDESTKKIDKATLRLGLSFLVAKNSHAIAAVNARKKLQLSPVRIQRLAYL